MKELKNIFSSNELSFNDKIISKKFNETLHTLAVHELTNANEILRDTKAEKQKSKITDKDEFAEFEDDRLLLDALENWVRKKNKKFNLNNINSLPVHFQRAWYTAKKRVIENINKNKNMKFIQKKSLLKNSSNFFRICGIIDGINVEKQIPKIGQWTKLV